MPAMAPHVHRWSAGDPRCIVLIAHGYGEHAGRYEHVARRLVDDLGAAVYAPDHRGHGRTSGATGLVEDGEAITTDLHDVADEARAEHAGLPVALIGHSMGGLIATRYAQRFGDELAALVLSGPVIGANPAFEQLLALDPIPDVPIDPAVLSRDPAVGEAYAADDLVYHGPFQRATLEQLFAGIERVAQDGGFGDLPTLWIHGADDQLVPLELTRPAMERLRGTRFTEHVYAGARHEVFNETNRDEVLDDVIAFLRGALPPPPPA
jgi:alpha-beta hydrolase superfamily lysophospholipase